MADTCVKLERLVTRIRRILNDDIRTCVVANDGTQVDIEGSSDLDAVRWETDEILDVLHEGMTKLMMARPDAFAETVELTLDCGPKQKLPDDYDKLVRLDFNVIKSATDSKTIIGKPITESDEEYSRYITSKCGGEAQCKPEKYEVDSYSISTGNEDEFAVSPAVPSNTTPMVCATVIKNPPPLGEADLEKCVPFPVKYQAIIVDWAMYRLLSKDVESSFLTRKAETYRRGFYDCIDFGYSMESKYGSGYYLGEKGDGDERKA